MNGILSVKYTYLPPLRDVDMPRVVGASRNIIVVLISIKFRYVQCSNLQ